MRPRKTGKQQAYATRVARKPAYLRAILGAVLLLRNIKYQSRGQENNIQVLFAFACTFSFVSARKYVASEHLYMNTA